MKKTLIAGYLFFGLNFTQAQNLKESEVPAVVLDAFKKEHPEIKSSKWEKEGDNYEVEFKLNKIENSIGYNASGNWIEKEVEIKPSELPKNALDYFEKNLPGKKIKEACKITAADGKITYEAEVEDTEYQFHSEGNLLKQEKEKGWG